ncbi:hypothetical protein [Izhakiella australiensis]|uniref:hypothetical protein n=1 Tax=Izhakiella australiensis TaxID=1926881 RepID=UPI001115A5FB|nr:hypothetical protein [Izhakiella australiensis]
MNNEDKQDGKDYRGRLLASMLVIDSRLAIFSLSLPGWADRIVISPREISGKNVLAVVENKFSDEKFTG